jgi:hypothetical protein
MTLSIDQIKASATNAGESVGKAHHRLRDLIKDVFYGGVASYESAEFKAARKAFAEAAEAGGTSKNSGHTLFARAWDSLIADGIALEERGRKGKGGKPAKESSDNASDASDASDATRESAPAESAADAIERARPGIMYDAAVKICDDAGLTAGALRDAFASVLESRNRAKAITDAAAVALIDDMLATLVDMGQRIESAIKSANAIASNAFAAPIVDTDAVAAEFDTADNASDAAPTDPDDMTDSELLEALEIETPTATPAKPAKGKGKGKPAKSKGKHNASHVSA